MFSFFSFCRKKPFAVTQISIPSTIAGQDPVQEEVITIALDKAYSLKANDKMKELAYVALLKKYNEHPSYHLSRDEDGSVKLIPNHRPRTDRPDVEKPKDIDPADGDCYFVILLDKITHQPVLRIMAAPHYFLADKASSVLAAGTIFFKDKKIVDIDDQSGSYHINPGWMSHYQFTSIEKKEYKDSMKIIFQSVGLPYQLFTPYFNRSQQEVSRPQ